MNDLFFDIGFAWRNALKKPGITLLIIITLALGIGANSAMFSMTYNVMFAPLPYQNGDKLVRLEQHELVTERMDYPFSVQSFFDYRDQNNVFSDLLEYHGMNFTLYGHGDPLRVQTGVVNWNYFDLLGVTPILGRSFLPGEDAIGAEPLILLSYEFWVREFDSDPDVIGSSLEMNNAIHTVIGVLPTIPAYPDDNDIWIGIGSCPFRSSEGVINNRQASMVQSYGILDEGVTLEEATLDLNTISQRLLTSYPDSYSSARGYTTELVTVKEEMVGESGKTFLLLFGIAGLVLLIASANVANLNLAKLSSRNQELAIREAIGAKPNRIIRQLFTESIFFSLIGGGLGILVAYPCLSLLSDFAARYTSLSGEIKMDGTILIFSLLVALLTGIISGSASAFTKRDINKSLKEGGNKVTASVTGKRKREVLLIIQYALSFVILTISALVILSLTKLNNEDSGYDPAQLLVVNMDLNFTNYNSPQLRKDFGIRVIDAINLLSEVELAGISGESPLQGANRTPTPFDIDGRMAVEESARTSANNSTVSEDYFNAMSIQLLKGRMFSSADDENAELVTMINRSFEERYFPSGDAIGEQLSTDNGQTWMSIVGVVNNVRSVELDQIEGDTFYLPFRQAPTNSLGVFIKSQADLSQLGDVVQDLIHSFDSQQAIHSVKSMQEIKQEWLATPRLVATLISLFGVLALVVTLSGVVGVVSYNVSQRLREIGVHMAIGANPGHILKMFLKQGLGVHAFGLILGVILMAFSAQFIEDFLYQTSALNFEIYFTVAAVLTVVVVGAMMLPAKKASEMNPAAALHSE